jgi:hypothetical protein
MGIPEETKSILEFLCIVCNEKQTRKKRKKEENKESFPQKKNSREYIQNELKIIIQTEVCGSYLNAPCVPQI